MTEPYIGQIELFPFNYVPDGWMKCEGQTLQVRQYQALYSVLGVTYGGDRVNTFQLPDLRGRAAIGRGQAPGFTGYVEGAKGGAEGVTLTPSTVPPHGHVLAASMANGATVDGTNNFFAKPVLGVGQPAQNLYGNVTGTADQVKLNPGAVSTVGGGLAHDNMQPFCVLTYAIAVQGIYPPRN